MINTKSKYYSEKGTGKRFEEYGEYLLWVLGGTCIDLEEEDNQELSELESLIFHKKANLEATVELYCQLRELLSFPERDLVSFTKFNHMTQEEKKEFYPHA